MTMNKLRLKPASESDLSEIMQIIQEAKVFLKEQNIPQWQDGKPSESMVIEDIKNGIGYVLVDDNRVVATAALTEESDPFYEMIDGSWSSNVPYASIHRVAVSSHIRGKKVSKVLISELIKLAVFKGYSNIRIDTHEKNCRMQQLILKSGFLYCGVIHVDDKVDSKRLAYDRLL